MYDIRMVQLGTGS